MRIILMAALALPVAACQTRAEADLAARPPPPQPFCTRTLGVADCFVDPARLPDHPAQLADGPTAPASPVVDPRAAWKRVLDWADR